MKCMMRGDKVVRVTNDKAREMAKEGWRYVPKSLWKKEVRDKK